MQNLLEGGLDATSWIFIIVLLVLVVLYFVSFFLRNKKDKQRREELYSGLKKGDYAWALRLGSACGSATAFSDTLATRTEIESLLNR